MGMDEAEKFWKHYAEMPKEVQLQYMNDRFGQLTFDESRIWEDYQSEHDELERLKSKIEFFEIPSMVVHKDDIIAQFEGRDDFAEMKKIIENLTFDQMESIASRMTDMMMYQFNIAVKEAFEYELENLDK